LEGKVFDILWSLPSKGYQKHYLTKDIKKFTFQRISKTLPSKGYQKHYLPKDITHFQLDYRKIKIRLLWLEWMPFCPLQGK
jgi:hypothetical protein